MKNKLLALGLGAWLLGGALSYGHEGKRDRDHDEREDRAAGEKGGKSGPVVPAAVPDTNTGWVFFPLVGALLLYHLRSKERVRIVPQR